MLVIGAVGWDFLGAPVTALPDSTGLVYRAAPGNPLGLEPGDIILGYEGVPWRQLYRQLLDDGVPVSHYCSMRGSTPQAVTQLALSGVGWNWGMFDTIDVIKYATGQTVHLSTSPLRNLSQTLLATDQVPVAGVQMPQWNALTGPSVSYGVVQGTNVGYIYVYDWLSPNTSGLFHDAIYDLRYNKKVVGLIIDFRMNWGGAGNTADAGYSLLFGSYSPGVFMDMKRSDASYHLGFTCVGAADLGFATTSTFEHPIAVLIGPSCFSAGDFHAYRLKFHPMARFFGLPTNGACVWGVRYIGSMSDSWIYTFPTDVTYSSVAGGGYLIHRGVQPDEQVWLTKDGVAKGQDDVVMRAIAWIDSTNGTVAVKEQSRLPMSYALDQNYPNPFNPSTTIRYRVPKAGNVVLTVVDLLGREVAVLVNEQKQAGAYEVRLNGSKLASGVYFYRMVAGAFSQTKTMMLVK